MGTKDIVSAMAIANKSKPTGTTDPSTSPPIPSTGISHLDNVTDVINTTVAPFTQTPPSEQGTAGVVAQKVGGVLGVIGAPQMLIDTAFASLTAPLAKMMPPMPAITLLGMHLGIPHAHAHPPSVGTPLPSIGMLVGSGAMSVLLCGLPAARAGDIGLAVTCGTFAPPFEIFTGSSNVFIAGARAARLLDLTIHCNPTSMGVFSKILSGAGLVVGAANAVATKTAPAAAQAAADAAVLAIRLLCGKDPGVPPGVGMLLGPPMPNVLIGGFPCPPIGEMAMGGLLRALGKAVRSIKSRSSRKGNGVCADGSHPIYLVTGENFDSYEDFVSGGLFEWRRHYTSARNKIDSPLGRGFRHFYQRSLSVRLHRATFNDWDGEKVEFDRFERGSSITRSEGYVLKRIARGRYRISFQDEPVMTFMGDEFEEDLPLVSLSTPTQELSLKYDIVGQLAEAVELYLETGQTRRYLFHYDETGHIVRIVEQTAAVLNKEGDIERPNRAVYNYSKTAELMRAEDALGGFWSYEYDAFHRLTKQTDPRQYSYTYRYDVHGRCIEAAGQDGLWWCTVEYHPDQRFTRYTEGDNATSEIHYDSDGFVTKIVDPYGGEKKRMRDGEGKLVSEVDSGGRELTWLYDEDGAHYARMDRFGHLFPPEKEMPDLKNPFERTLPNTAQARLFAGVVPPSLEAGSSAESSLYSIVPPELFDTARACLDAGLKAMRNGESPDPAEPRVERDDMNRKTRETDALGRTTEWTYDETGNIVAIRDRDGHVSTRDIVSWNLVGAQRDPLGNAMRFQYSRLEQIVGVVDPLGNDTKYDHDLKNRLVRIHRCGRLLVEYIYDEGDHFIEKRDSAGQMMFRNVIHDSHMVAVRHLANGGYHRYDYDAKGRITEASTDQHEVYLSYNGSDIPDSDLWDGNGVETEHKDAKRKTVVLGRFAVCIAADEDGAVEIEDAAGLRSEIAFNSAGLVRRTCSNGTVELLQYDGDGRLLARLVQRRKKSNGPKTHWQVIYHYTPEGDLIRVQDNLRGNTTYEIDAAHRLVGELGPDGKKRVYIHDAAGNLNTKPEAVDLVIGKGNHLERWGPLAFEYNDEGHLSACRLQNGTLVRYRYDSFDMLVAIDQTVSSGKSIRVWEAAYDALGRRLWTQTGKEKHKFYWHGDRLAAERFANDHLRIYAYAGEQSLVPLSFTDYESESTNPATGRSYQVFSDPVGMPLCIEDEAGEIVWHAERIDPFGLIDVAAGARITYNLRWPGHYYDDETGLHYNRYRYYAPSLGRYLQSDPIGYGGSPVNLYAYCDNPLVAVDVLGLAKHRKGGDNSDGSNENSGKEKKASTQKFSNKEVDNIIENFNLKQKNKQTLTTQEIEDVIALYKQKNPTSDKSTNYFKEKIKNGDLINPNGFRFNQPDKPKVICPSNMTKDEFLNKYTGKDSTSSLKQFVDMLENEGFGSKEDVKKIMMDPGGEDYDNVRHSIKEYYKKQLVDEMAKGSDKDSYKKMKVITSGLHNKDRSNLTEAWYKQRYCSENSKTNGLFNKKPGLDKNSIPDIVDGETFIEIKSHTSSKLAQHDSDQLKKMQSAIDSGDSEYKLKKMKYVFTNKEGANANQDIICEKLLTKRNTSIEVFDNDGNRHWFKYGQEKAFKTFLKQN